MPRDRVLLANGNVLSSALACALLAACATSQEPAAPTVVRTRAPVAYEKTINNYMAFKLRPQKNTRISVAPPEPGDCPLDGTPQSIRGWVVPVTHETFSGELTGKDTIRITAKPYWFWFSGETIAGITPRGDLCPGIVSAFDEAAKPRQAAPAVDVTAPTTPTRAEASEAARPVAPAKPAAKKTAKTAKKKPASSTSARQATEQATKPKEQQAPAKPSE